MISIRLNPIIIGTSKGEIVLRPFTSSDLTFIFDALNLKRIDEKELTISILHHQLLKPELSLKSFKEFSEKELIRIGISYANVESEIFKSSIRQENFYVEFQSAVQSYKKKIENLVNENIKPVLSLYTTSMKQVQELLKTQMTPLQNWLIQLSKLTEAFRKSWIEIEKKHEENEIIAAEILRKYKWFISPSLPVNFAQKVLEIDNRPGRQDKAINQLFINYFSDNNWQHLDEMATVWEKIPLFRKRNKIIRDCIEILRNPNIKQINHVVVILPTLIIQIDGLISDYNKKKGIVWSGNYYGRNKHKEDRLTKFENSLPEVLGRTWDELANDCFLHQLFKTWYPGDPVNDPFNFNRHKIIHGESTRYGRKDYLIRVLLIFDWLAHLDT